MKRVRFLEKVSCSIFAVYFFVKTAVLLLFCAVTGRGQEVMDRHLRSMI